MQESYPAYVHHALHINGTFFFRGRFYTALPDTDPEIDTPHIGKLVFKEFDPEIDPSC